jgi:quinol monooxygenase YgiN
MSPGAAEDASVVLVVEFTARPDTLDELRERLLRLVALTRTEDGCLRYDLHGHPDDPLRLTFVEEWASPAAHAAHDGTDWVRDIREHLPRLVAGRDGDGGDGSGIRVTRLARLEP